MTELTLVLSGHLCTQESGALRSFWSSFIELQKRLPTGKPVCQVVAHSWNPDLAPLVSLVYAPTAERHEYQVSFYSEFIQKFDPLDLFKQGLNLETSTLQSMSTQSALSNACSRSRALGLMDELPSPKGQVLITSWDLGRVVSEDVNHIIVDAYLPEDYIYMPYLAEVDEGYADGWMLAPWVDARHFRGFYDFVLDCLAGRNHYLKLFSQAGWPRARVKTRFEIWWLSPVGRSIKLLASKLVKSLWDWSDGVSISQRLVRRFTSSLQRSLFQPPVTAENSCILGLKARAPTFPISQATKIPALLKYFILSKGLRDRVRFLTGEDFNIGTQSGQLINPQPIVLLVHEEGDSEMVRLLAESPLPLAAVYMLGARNVHQHVPDGQGGWRITKLHAAGIAPRDLMVCALEAEQKRDKELLPVMIIPTLDRFIGCRDWFYMNALVKYLAWSRIGYVSLVSSVADKPYLDFPDLYLTTDAETFSLYVAVGNLEGIRALLNLADPELLKISDHAQFIKQGSHVVLNRSGLF